MADDLTLSIEMLGADAHLAHAVLFRHRHTDATPDFHREMISDIHSELPALIDLAFRGAAKSTRIEEAMTIAALYGRFGNGIIIGENYDRGCERLAAIKHELESNDLIADLFGPQVGTMWSENRIVLPNGVIIQAFGRGQSLRGSKYLEQRPDYCFVDDVEDESAVETPEARRKVFRWFMRTVIPALAPGAIIRIAATPLDPESLPMRLSQIPGWTTRTYPIERLNGAGEREALWPSRFPLAEIDRIKKSFEASGHLLDFMQEYMCEAQADSERTFREDDIRVEPRVRSWEATYVMIDPARTVKATSATTGIVAWSWIGNRLIVWEAKGQRLLPDEIVAECFRLDEAFHPIWIGVEEDGLNEFILQPLRHEQVKRGVTLPIRAVRAPPGKLGFIRALQPFFRSGEVIFAESFPEFRAQLLGFPRGAIDIPNALAYALRLRPGIRVYDDFGIENIAEEIVAERGRPIWLAINAAQGRTAAALVQSTSHGMAVIADWYREDEPLIALAPILREAQLEAGGMVRLLAAPAHFDQWHNVGLIQAAGRIPMEVARGAAPAEGRAELQDMLQRRRKGIAEVRVAQQARWTLNGFAGGYARMTGRDGVLVQAVAEDGPYRLVMEALESFAGLLRLQSDGDDANDRNYATSPTGRRYLSAMPQRR